MSKPTMKRFKLTRFTEYQLIPTVENGVFDNRRNKKAWKYIALNWLFWKLVFNYGLVDYSKYNH